LSELHLNLNNQVIQLTQIFRSIFRDRLNTLVIIVSLAVGLTSVNLIALFLSRELKTDDFHQYKDRIYGLKCDDPFFPGKKMYYCRAGSAEYMKLNFPQVEDFCRLKTLYTVKTVADNKDFDNPLILGASENFFRFFSYTLLTNNPESVLESPGNLAISTELARKYFGTGNPVGKIITLVGRDSAEHMMVSGIFEKPAGNTQINFDVVRSTGNVDSRCYLRLKENTDPKELENLFDKEKNSIPIVSAGSPDVRYYLEPFMKAYFDKSRGSAIEKSRDKSDLLTAMIIGILILVISVFNYLGILTNRYYRKIREFYVRRINGGPMLSLVSRFMLENSILVIISLVISIALMQDALPFFNSLTGSNITVNTILQSGQLQYLLLVPAFILLITLLFAVYLVRRTLDLKLLKSDGYLSLRSIHIPVFNIFQLAGSIALIICSLVIVRQMNYITNKPIGLDKEVIEIKIPPQYSEKAPVFKGELMGNSSIKGVSVVGASPVLEHWLVALKYQENGVEMQYTPAGFSGDENYLRVLGIELVAGTGFSGSPSDKSKCLVNESFARLFRGQDLVGKGMPGMEKKIIAGIVKDFNYSDLKSYVEPAFISFDDQGGHLLVKATESRTGEAMSAISAVWKKLIPDYPVDIESVGDRFEWFHRDNVSFKKLIGSCAIISLFLSLIGLFALSYQKTRSRTKEIGIRKINGSTIAGILALITSDFIRWTAIATIAAIPAAWFAMHSWLENYAYKTSVKWWLFLLSGTIVLGTVLVTVFFQSYRAATRNPVEALRYE